MRQFLLPEAKSAILSRKLSFVIPILIFYNQIFNAEGVNGSRNKSEDIHLDRLKDQASFGSLSGR